MTGVLSGGSNTSTSTTSPNSQVLGDYQALVNRATGVANTPYTAYPGEQVAPLSNQTNTGLANVDQYAYAAQPYLSAAGNMVGQGGQYAAQGQNLANVGASQVTQGEQYIPQGASAVGAGLGSLNKGSGTINQATGYMPQAGGMINTGMGSSTQGAGMINQGASYTCRRRAA